MNEMALAYEDIENPKRCREMNDKTILKLFLQAKHLQGLSPLTIKSYDREISHFLEFIHNEGKILANLKPADVRLYLAEKPDAKATTIATKVATLKSLFKFLVNEEYVTTNVMDKVETPKIGKHLPKFLTLEEINAVRKNCKSVRDRALFELFYSTGARLSEIWALNRDSLDWENHKILITGKGDKQRVVMFSAHAEEYIKKYLATRTDDNPALFISTRGNRLGRRDIEYIMNRLGEKAGLKKHVHPHLWRHTLASQAVQNGVDIQTVSEILGHSSISTTQIYAHLTDKYIEKQYEKIPL